MADLIDAHCNFGGFDSGVEGKNERITVAFKEVLLGRLETLTRDLKSEALKHKTLNPKPKPLPP